MSDIGVLQAALITVEIVLGALAIMVGLGAVFSYNWLNKQARETAQRTAEETMNKFLEESNIKEMLENRVRTEGNKLFQDMAQSSIHDLSKLEEKEIKND